MQPAEASYVARWELDDVLGVVAAVDVLRAFTTAAFALAGGASMIWQLIERARLGQPLNADATSIRRSNGQSSARFEMVPERLSDDL